MSVILSEYYLMINKDVTNHIFNICGDTPRKMQYFTDKLIELSGLHWCGTEDP